MEDIDTTLPLTFTTLGVAALDVVSQLERMGMDYRSSNKRIVFLARHTMQTGGAALGAVAPSSSVFKEGGDPRGV